MVSLEKNNKTLILRHGEKAVFTITEGERAFYPGVGDSEFKMSHGSFKISKHTGSALA